MPTHARETLLVEMEAVLVAAATSMGSRIRRGRQLPVENAELPMGNIFQGPEQSNLNDVNFLLYREFEAAVQIFERSLASDQNEPDIDTKLNELARQAEVALQANPSLNGKCLDIQLIRTVTDTEAADRDYGSIVLVWKVIYRTQRTDPSTLG